MIGRVKGQKLYEIEKKLSEYQGEDRIVSSTWLSEELKKTEESVFIIPTGIPTFDRLHDGGVEAGELIVVTGPTGEGKTSWLMSITKNMSEVGVSSVWFTLEVTPRQFLKKIMKSDGTVPLFYVPNDNTDNQVDWIEQRIIEAKVKYNAKVVFIDHIHQIMSLAKMEGKNTNMSWEIGDLVGKIKNIAITHNLTVFLIAHSKDDPAGTAREPRKEDIRDSGLISRLADSIVGIWRVPNDDTLENTRRKPLVETDTKSKVRVFKNRRTGKVAPFFMYHENHYLKEDTITGRANQDFDHF